MSKQLLARVYVEKSVYHIDRAFDYAVSSGMQSGLKRGCRVIVPFGNANKKVQGLVVETVEVDTIGEKIKPVFSQLDKEPIVNEEGFAMIDFLVKNTFCTYYDAVKAILPIGASVDVTESYRLVASAAELEIMQLTEDESRLLQFLKSAKTQKELSGFLNAGAGNVAKCAVVRSLIEKGIIEKADSVNPRVKTKTVRMVRIAEGFDPQGVKFSPKQAEVIRLLSDMQTAMVKELCYFCGITEGVVKTLAKRQIVEYYDRAVEKSYDETPFVPITLDEIELSAEQQSAYEGILSLTKSQKANVALLHGITGSGKTQVYIKLIEQCLKEGKSAMLLVPEIALTPQMVQKFRSLFGNVIAVIHSSLTIAERLDEFERIRRGLVKIVIGTRSAVFSPLENIGLIIMDEEGESSYKSDSSPRYHAREVAKLRCVMHNATLLLGSATPSIESYYNAKEGKYSLFTLEERYKNANLPYVYIVDMLEEQRLGNFSPLSEILSQQLLQNLNNNEQSMLLINRRGYNSYATCMQCGYVITCQSCDRAMTYHKANGYMMCHYCGHTIRYDGVCPECKGKYLKFSGTGTQRLQDELQTLFPSARILRMDTDTTYSRYSYEKAFEDFSNGKYDILLGTQMIAKGLDFPNVTLVGVLNAESGLYSADFKSSERVFSLITQVVGRSGRSEKSGRAYIQTMCPEDELIHFAANQDYKGFYESELAARRMSVEPPFCDICVIGFAGVNEKAVQAAAYKAMETLKKLGSATEGIKIKVLGAAPANVYKISNKYRWRIVIKCHAGNRFKAFLSELLKTLCTMRELVGVTIYADINGDTSV